MRLLFVCTGNTCRSPMAEALAGRMAAGRGLDRLEVASAGIAAEDGQPASPGARRAMESRGLSIEAHRARRLTPELAGQSDLILTMTAAHAKAVERIAPGARIYALREYVGEAGDVTDPWGGPDLVYEECARRLEGLIARAVERAGQERREA